MEYRGFIVKSDGVFSYNVISLPKGGTLAAALRGYFTTTPQAFKAIDAHLSQAVKTDDRPVLRTKKVSEKKKASLK